MRYLIDLSNIASTETLGLMLDEAEIYYRNGHEVVVLYCSESLGICCINPVRSKLLCGACHFQRNIAFSKISKEIKLVSVGSLVDKVIKKEINSTVFDYQSVIDIKKLKFHGVEIGYAAFSSYVTLTRNLNPLLDNHFRVYFNRFLSAGVLKTLVTEKCFDIYKPDYVILFNGRFVESKPVWQLAKMQGIPFECIDTVRPNNLGDVRKVRYKNGTTHEIELNTGIYLAFWNKSQLSEFEKEKCARAFYEDRKHAKFAGDKIYTSDQALGMLPEAFSSSERNIVILNSSEDELYSISNEFEKRNLFPSQIDGITFIGEFYKDQENVRIYLRVHPNLTKINYRYHHDLYKLSSLYPKLVIIPANAKVSTYSLIDEAEKVIVFGSTTGIEATYWRKPVINLATAFYDNLDVCYRPSDVEELEELLASSALIPKDQCKTLPFGFFYKRNEHEKYSYINYAVVEKKINLMGFQRSVLVAEFISDSLSGFYYLFYYLIFSVYRHVFCSRMPVKENI